MKLKIIISFLFLLSSLAACGPTPDIYFPEVTEASINPTNPPAQTGGIETIEMQSGFGARGDWFEVYFSDPSGTNASDLSGGVDEYIASSIDTARQSLDVAIYNLSNYTISNALIRAHERGVVVRVVTDSDNLDKRAIEQMTDAGIEIFGDRREGIMHDKFIVIDRSEVWTGSMNFTLSGAYDDNNNMIHIRSTKMAEDYTTEFEEMFIDDLFGDSIRAANPNPVFSVDGIELQVYFSPDDGVQDQIVDLVRGAQSSIRFLAFSFTSNEIGEAIMERAGNGVIVEGVMDASQVASNQGTEYDRFNQAGFPVYKDGIEGLMHHKVFIIDERIVILGSYNFSTSAEIRNDENIVIVFDEALAALYLEEFQRVFELSQR